MAIHLSEQGENHALRTKLEDQKRILLQLEGQSVHLKQQAVHLKELKIRLQDMAEQIKDRGGRDQVKLQEFQRESEGSMISSCSSALLFC